MNTKYQEQEFLKNYNTNNYEKPSVTVDVVALTIGEKDETNYRKNTKKRLKVLLMKRTDFPFKDMWALPGGFVDIRETLEDATARVLLNKTDLSKAYLEQLYTWDEIDRDPRHRIFSISYLTLIQEDNLQTKSADKTYEWFNLSMDRIFEKTEKIDGGERWTTIERLEFESEKESFIVTIELTRTMQERLLSQSYRVLENDHIAFDHPKIIAYALKRLREKIEYTPIAFSLMPSRFTLTQLQQVYETILNRVLLKANFRRKIANMVIETEEYKKDAGHRPSKLFKFNNKFDL